jgi:hypothetical protein
MSTGEWPPESGKPFLIKSRQENHRRLRFRLPGDLCNDSGSRQMRRDLDDHRVSKELKPLVEVHAGHFKT